MNLRILLVESDETMRLMLSTFLKRHGYRVVDVESVEEGMEALQGQESFDWVVSNAWVTSKHSGPEFLKKVLLSYPNIHCLLISGAGDPGGHGAFFLQKPFLPSKVLDIFEATPSHTTTR